MGSSGPGVPGHALFLLLVLPPFPMNKGSFLYSVSGSRDFHRLGLSWESLHSHLSLDQGRFHHRRSLGAWLQEKHTKDKKSCQSSYDLYFILDK